MTIITISRGTFSGGLRFAELMAQGLGYPLVSREQLYASLQRDFGFTQEEISDILDRIPTGARFAAERSPGNQLGAKRRRLVAGLTACLCDLVQGGDAVYHGYAGHLLLPDISHVLRIRVIAPHDKRVQMIVERKAMSPMEAGRYIERMDSERERWTRFVFGVDWSDPSLFDLTLNLESMEIEEAAETAMVAARLERFRPTNASLTKIEELSRSSREAALTDKPCSPISGEAQWVGSCEPAGEAAAGCGEPARQQNEISVLERFALRWAVLAAWTIELRERKAEVTREVDKRLEVSRVKLASGCFSSCEIGSDLGYVEGILMPTDASLPQNKCDFWLELLAQAMEDIDAVKKLISVPAVEFQLSSCGVTCKCGT